MATTDTQTPALEQLDQLADDARARLEELDAEEARLSLDAHDDEGWEALRNVGVERASALSVIRRSELARSEAERREQQAIEDAERARCEKELARARKIDPRVRAAAEKIDSTAGEFAKALATYADLSGEQGSALQRAGERHLKPADSAFTAALVRAFFDADTPRGMIDLGGIPPRPCPLVEALPSQPLGKEAS
jgi:hypothetical protein